MIATNPLTARLIRTTRRPSLRELIWLAAGLAAITLALSGYELARLVLHPRGAVSPIGGVPYLINGAVYSRVLSISNGFEAGISPRIAVIAWLIALLTPVLIGLVAAVQTARDAQSDALTLLRLTGLRRARIVRGYWIAALYRMRLLLAVSVGLTPALIGGTLALISYIMTYQTFQSYMMFYRAVYTPTLIDLISLTLVIGGAAVGLIAASLAASALGVMLGLWLRNPIGAAIGTTLLTALGVWGTLSAVVWWLSPLRLDSNYLHTAPMMQLAGTSLLCLVPPILLGVGCIRLATYLIRRSTGSESAAG